MQISDTCTHVRLAKGFLIKPMLAGRAAVAVAAIALVLGGCGEKEQAQGAEQAPQPPAPQVGVVTAQAKTVGMVADLPGRVEASRVAQVRARVAGILERRLFTEGSDVKAGQLLARIDSQPYAAALQSAQASLAQAQVGLNNAKNVVERNRPLVEVNAISKLDFENVEAAYKTAKAQVAVAKAALQTAQINFDYASVKAPISGRIGRALVTEGALVGQGTPTELAVIQQIDTVYVNFTQASAHALNLRGLMQQGRLQKVEGENSAVVQVIMEDGSLHSELGKLLFTDLSVDPSSGQVTLRAEVPNKNQILLPGMYVRVRIEQAQIFNAIALPQQAVSRGEQGDTVTIVDAQGNREVRPVKVSSAASGNRWVIEDGVKEGEQVMVDGFQALQMMPPNVKVKAVPWQEFAKPVASQTKADEADEADLDSADEAAVSAKDVAKKG